MPKFFSNKSRLLGIIAVASAACTFGMAASIPYHVHQGIYVWYLWTERLIPYTGFTALVAAVSTFALARGSRRLLPVVLAAVSCALLVCTLNVNPTHSGPNPQAWCYNNLRKMEAAKRQLASENQFADGVAITAGQISKYVQGGFDTLKCAEHGSYAIGAVGGESRCSVHGSISEIDRGWQKAARR